MTYPQSGVDLYSCSEQILIYLKPGEHVVYTRHHSTLHSLLVSNTDKNNETLVSDSAKYLANSAVYYLLF